MFRGSLKQCIENIQTMFSQNAYQMLSIVVNPTGKYYTVMTEDNLTKYNDRHISDKTRLVARLTPRELAQFAKTVLPDLFIEEPDAKRT